MDDNDFITIGDTFPQIEAVAPLAGLVVLVTWATGKQVAVDLGPTLHRFKVYAPLRADRALFETVHVANASTIAWGADDAIDMHVNEIERLAGERMEASDFKAWMSSLGMTLDSAAAALGMSRRMVAYYASGREIPRYVALACAHLADADAIVSENFDLNAVAVERWAGSGTGAGSPEERIMTAIFGDQPASGMSWERSMYLARMGRIGAVSDAARPLKTANKDG